ncbi:hypothetical protein [Methanobacterium formicicum]|nr:hypothetical protein [Methanobacterium formicicum]MDG3547702.1 hypothetical protein [Methanobacterium formicicum]
MNCQIIHELQPVILDKLKFGLVKLYSDVRLFQKLAGTALGFIPTCSM